MLDGLALTLEARDCIVQGLARVKSEDNQSQKTRCQAHCFSHDNRTLFESEPETPQLMATACQPGSVV